MTFPLLGSESLRRILSPPVDAAEMGSCRGSAPAGQPVDRTLACDEGPRCLAVQSRVRG